MKKNQNTQTKELRECFPEIPEEKAKKIDIKIKVRIHAYEPSRINEDIADYIREQVTKECVKTKNVKRIKKKCNKLASYYIQASRTWILQENWFCVLAYLISIVSLICRVIEIDTALNDRITFLAHLSALGIWLCLVISKKFMNRSAELFLDVFNRAAPSIIIFTSLFFYLPMEIMPIEITNTKIYRISVIVLWVLFCLWVIVLWFVRTKNNT